MSAVTPGGGIFYYPGPCSHSRVFLDMDSGRGGVGQNGKQGGGGPKVQRVWDVQE